MRHVLTFLAVFAVAATAARNERLDRTDPTPSAKADEFVVHEWGTFTSVSGSDGVRLEFRPLVDDDLPNFVLDRARQSGLPDPFGGKFGYRVFQRMETPVTYFYTDRERDVRVKVGFPTGLLTEFYPPVAAMKPEFDWKKRAAVGNSELDWGQVTLIPTSHLRTHVITPELCDPIQARVLRSLLPDSDSHNHYGFARETDSALVHVRRTRDTKRPAALVGDFFEKFLFYRGIGNFPLPLTITSQGDGHFELTNAGPDPIRSLFLVTVHGQSVRFRKYDAVAAGGRLRLEQSPQASSIDALSEAVVESLIAETLFEPEARAMVKTWRDSWFTEEGTRLFYMLPERLTDELLPLTIEPRPDKVVRVMVGRMEVMTPEDEARITQLVRTHAAERAEAVKRAAENQAATQGQQSVNNLQPGVTLPPSLLAMGRLAEPALVGVKFFSRDTVVRAEAALLLNELHQRWAQADEEAKSE
jgi:hypothetical protein